MYYTAYDLRSALGSQQIDASRRLFIESLEAQQRHTHDIFLSHSRLDAAVVLGLKRVLETLHLTVYVDWIDDPQLDRTHVTPATADHLRVRMEESRSLVYAYSRAASRSTWMSWELGYFDGRKGSAKVAVCPIDSTSPAVAGQEFIGLYKTLEKLPLALGHRVAFVSANRRNGQTAAEFINGRPASVSKVE